MNYQTPSPSDCAAEVLAEILKCVNGDDIVLKDRIERLVRQKVRTVFEQCAMIAEDYVADHDRANQKDGWEIGDGIAELIRQACNERGRVRSDDRLLQAYKIAAD